jgi:uncharacterized protein YqfA (UPF0365 family)
MSITKKLSIVLFSGALLFACDNSAKEQLEQCKVEALQAMKLAKESEVKALDFIAQAEKMAANVLSAQDKVKEALAALEDCKGGK